MLAELEIDTIAMMAHLVVCDSQSIAFPAMDATSHDSVFRDIALHLIMLHSAKTRLLEHNGEHVVFEDIVDNPHIAHILSKDASIVEP